MISRYAIIMVLLAALSPFVATAQAQQPPTGRDEPATKFERFTLAKGTVRVREYYLIGTIASQGAYSTRFEVARAYTPGQSDHVLALLVHVRELGRLSRDRTGILDADEVASLGAAIPQITRMVEILRQSQDAKNTEVDFKGGSLRLTVFVNKLGQLGREGVAITAGDIGSVTAFLDINDLERIRDYLVQAVAKIRDLQQKR